MLSVERTTDCSLIKTILTTPELYNAIKDDGSCSPEEFVPNAEWCHLIVKSEDEILGLIQFQSVNSVCVQAHINILPRYWGKRFDAAATLGLQWLRDNTKCLKVIATIPAECMQVLAASKRYGFIEEGFIKDSIKRNGKLQGQYLVGLNL